jgi:hypothetical protein
MVIASRGEGALIDTGKQQVIEYRDNEEIKRVSMPLVIFGG